MRRVFGLMAVVAAVGCHTTKKTDLRSPHVEEFNPPPNEARYNHPPEDKYRRRNEIKDQAREMGANGPVGAFDPNGGMGGMPGQR